MKNVLLINPPWLKDYTNKWSKISSCMPPFGLAILAAILRNDGINVTILDCNALRIPLTDTKKYFPATSPDFIGITASTPLIKKAYDIAGQCREVFLNSKIVMGGVHSTVMPDEALNLDCVDFVVRSEGEVAFLKLIKQGNAVGVDNVSYKDNGEIVHNDLSTTVLDLNSIPMPAYDLLPMKEYFSALGSYKRKPSMGMLTTRGCPGKCTFCNPDIFGKKIRYRHAEKILQEVLYLKNNFGIREISFYDDNFTTFKKNLRHFCELLLSNNADITWSCFSRIDTVDKDTLKLMKEAGCHQIMYGIESSNPDILKNMNKRIKLDNVEPVIRETQNAGIDVRAAFMLGNPGETEELLMDTIDYAIKVNPDLVIFNVTTPFPGSELFYWADKNGYLLTKDWDSYDFSKPVMSLPDLDSETIVKYYKKAYKKFYLRKNYLFKRFFKVRNLDDIKVNLDAFCAILK